ncbi:hypothetical protein B6F84_03735 [Acidianus manzaensis]|uniref:Zinc ribbon domain-containing protein n=2 Tax=Acidianus manzaensis TaxID=282676 RepID=A0A1W6JY84_9CREN|nr:hypothetical protein B6F84_03735 [Acidianus manzaensis]
MNDDISKYCINCGYQLDLPAPKKHNYKKIAIPSAIAIIVALAFVIALPTVSALMNSGSSVIVLSASDAHNIFGGTWTVIENQTFLKEYPEENITIQYANGTIIQIPYYHSIKSIDHEVMIGNISGTQTKLVINVIQTTTNTFFNRFMVHNRMGFGQMINIMMFGHNRWQGWNAQFSFNETTYDGYTIYYIASNIPYAHTNFIAVKNKTIIEISLNNYTATLSEMEEALNNIV